MRPLRQTWMSALLALAGVGCASTGNVDTLESQLRQQEDQITALQGQVTGLDRELRVAREEAGMLRAQLQSEGKRTLVSEQAEILSRAETIKFSPMLTSGVDLDSQPGDDAISVLLMPLDGDGDLVKLSGAVELELFDLSRPRAEQLIGEWKFSVDEARALWHRGFMSAGYLFHLNWQRPPQSRELTLHGRLVAPDGRQFNATQPLKVKLAVAASPPTIIPAKHEAQRVPAQAAPVKTSDSFTTDSIPRLR